MYGACVLSIGKLMSGSAGRANLPKEQGWCQRFGWLAAKGVAEQETKLVTTEKVAKQSQLTLAANRLAPEI